MDAFYQEEKNALRSKIMERDAATLKKVIEEHPDDMNAQLKLGVLYARRGYPDDAKKAFEAILTRAPENADALNNLGNLAFNAEDFPKALALYKRAEAASPNDASIKMNISMCLYRAGDIDGARAKFKEAEQIDPDLGKENEQLKSLLFE